MSSGHVVEGTVQGECVLTWHINTPPTDHHGTHSSAVVFSPFGVIKRGLCSCHWSHPHAHPGKIG